MSQDHPSPDAEPDQVRTVLAAVTGALPGGTDRPGQSEMADAVTVAIRTKQHLAVQAGTGTGKTLGYLVPAILAGRTTVVATATKNVLPSTPRWRRRGLRRAFRHRSAGQLQERLRSL